MLEENKEKLEKYWILLCLETNKPFIVPISNIFLINCCSYNKNIKLHTLTERCHVL